MVTLVWRLTLELEWEISVFSEVRLIQKFYRKIKKIQLYTTLLRLKKKPEKQDSRCLNEKSSWRIYGPCVDADTGEWRTRHNEESKNLFPKPDTIAEITRKILM